MRCMQASVTPPQALHAVPSDRWSSRSGRRSGRRSCASAATRTWSSASARRPGGSWWRTRPAAPSRSRCGPRWRGAHARLPRAGSTLLHTHSALRVVRGQGHNAVASIMPRPPCPAASQRRPGRRFAIPARVRPGCRPIRQWHPSEILSPFVPCSMVSGDHPDVRMDMSRADYLTALLPGKKATWILGPWTWRLWVPITQHARLVVCRWPVLPSPGHCIWNT